MGVPPAQVSSTAAPMHSARGASHRSRTMRQRRTGLIVSVAVLALTLVAGLVSAQITIFDPAITSRNTTIAVLKEVLLDTLGNEADRLRQMAKRLSAFTD